MAIPRDLYEQIRRMVRSETKYLRHYVGEVVSNQDPLQRGRVQVKVPALGWDSGAAMPWCWPRDKAGLVVPAVGAQVDVWFIVEGASARPVYGGQAGEMAGQTPTQSDGLASTMVLYEDPATGDYIKYDAVQKRMEANVSGQVVVQGFAALQMGAGTEAFALGTTLATFLNNLVTWIGAHTHPTAGTGPPSPPTPPGPPTPGTITSSKITGE